MTQTSIPMAKRTKQEILDAFEKLQSEVDDLKVISKTVHSPAAVETVVRAKEKSPQSIDKNFADFQAAIHTHLSDIRASLLNQAAAFQELQQAIDVSRQQLEVQHQISVAADTLENLVGEHAKRTTAFDQESEQRKKEFDEQMTAKKKTWEREMEEYEYQKKVKRERDLMETEEREKALASREAAMRSQEQEIGQMRKTIEQTPRELTNALEKQRLEIETAMAQQFAHEKALFEKETGSQIRLLELTVKNLQERITSQLEDIASLKQQADEANAKAQALAIKAIERPTTVVTPTPNPVSSFQDRQGRQN